MLWRRSRRFWRSGCHRVCRWPNWKNLERWKSDWNLRNWWKMQFYKRNWLHTFGKKSLKFFNFLNLTRLRLITKPNRSKKNLPSTVKMKSRVTSTMSVEKRPNWSLQIWDLTVTSFYVAKFRLITIELFPILILFQTLFKRWVDKKEKII